MADFDVQQVDLGGIRRAARRGDRGGIERRLPPNADDSTLASVMNATLYTHNETPLIAACRFGHVALIEYLHCMGANLECADADGMVGELVVYVCVCVVVFV